MTTAQEKGRRLETLTRLTQTVTATLALDDVLQRVVDAVVELFEGGVARLWLVDEDGGHVALRASAGVKSSIVGVTRFRVGEGLTGVIADRREPLVVPDVLHDRRTHNVDRARAERLVSFAGVPLLVGDRLLGVLSITSRQPRAYAAEDIGLLKTLASQAAVAIHNATVFSEERTRRAWLGALLDINTKIGSMASRDTLLTSIAEEAARLLDVDNAGFRLLDGEELVVAGVFGAARETMMRRRLRVGESLSGKVVLERRTLIAALDASADIIAEHLAADRRLGYTSFLGVPLHVADRTIGVLAFRARRSFTRQDAELAEAFAGQAAVAIEHSRLYEDARRQAERMTALADLGRLLSETLDPEKVGQRVADAICTLLEARSSALYRLDAATGSLVALTVSHEVGQSFPWTRELPSDNGIAWLAVRERRPVATRDVLADPRVQYVPEIRARIAQATARAVLGVPLLVQDRLFGVLAVGDETGRVFDDGQIRLAQAFADQAAVALENARLFHEEDRRRREAEELAHVARTLTESLDVAAVGERVVQSVLTLFSVQSSGLRLIRPDGSLIGIAQAGSSRAHFEPGTVVPAGVGLAGRAVSEGRTLWSSDVLGESGLVMTDDLRRRIVDSGDRAFLAIPLRAKGAVLGVLSVADRAGRLFSDTEIGLLEIFAHQAAVALENARLYGEAQERLRETTTLLAVTQALSRPGSNVEMMRHVTRE
ncbi:MAG: GAF domain-containing protein, partial [Candidatus Rokuibacteriota bacterium]